jgi:hypothetical protein
MRGLRCGSGLRVSVWVAPGGGEKRRRLGKVLSAAVIGALGAPAWTLNRKPLYRSSLFARVVKANEPGNRPSSIRLATEYVHALFRRPILDAVNLRRKRPGQADDRDIAHHNDVVDVGSVVVERDVGPGQHGGKVRAQRLPRALHDLRDRVDEIRREEVANAACVSRIEIGRPALEALPDRPLIGGGVGMRRRHHRRDGQGDRDDRREGSAQHGSLGEDGQGLHQRMVYRRQQ